MACQVGLASGSRPPQRIWRFAWATRAGGAAYPAHPSRETPLFYINPATF
ncbi:MAG TPA: hypothetical protein PLG25_12810 [bacterium]|nr:hypothetical protein [bacterium]HNE84754.1 hypothetical protein [bacterium]HNM14411.1 hypothetical protein [bacterium]